MQKTRKCEIWTFAVCWVGLILGLALAVAVQVRGASIIDIVTWDTMDRTVTIYAMDDATGHPKTDLTVASAGLSLWFRREGDAITNIVPVALGDLEDDHSDGGFIHIADGEYRLDLPDNAVAFGASHLDVGGTATGVVFRGGRVRLISWDLEKLMTANMIQVAGSVTAAVNMSNQYDGTTGLVGPTFPARQSQIDALNDFDSTTDHVTLANGPHGGAGASLTLADYTEFQSDATAQNQTDILAAIAALNDFDPVADRVFLGDGVHGGIGSTFTLADYSDFKSDATADNQTDILAAIANLNDFDPTSDRVFLGDGLHGGPVSTFTLADYTDFKSDATAENQTDILAAIGALNDFDPATDKVYLGDGAHGGPGSTLTLADYSDFWGPGGDPWATFLPGGYDPGTAGHILGTVGNVVWTESNRELTHLDEGRTVLNISGTLGLGVWDAASADHNDPGTFGAILNAGGGNGATPEQIWTYANRELTHIDEARTVVNIPVVLASGAWDAVAANYNTPGTMGELQNTGGGNGATPEQIWTYANRELTHIDENRTVMNIASTIAHGAWDATAADYNIPGSFGNILNTGGGNGATPEQIWTYAERELTALHEVRTEIALAQTVAGGAWNAPAAAYNQPGSFGEILNTGGGGGATPEQIWSYTDRQLTKLDDTLTFVNLASTVAHGTWDAQTDQYTLPGSFGLHVGGLGDGGSGGDVWGVYLPADYLPGQAGHILGTLDESVVVNYVGPVLSAGRIRIIRGDSYIGDFALEWTSKSFPDLSTKDVEFWIVDSLNVQQVGPVMATVEAIGDGEQKITVELTSEQTAAIDGCAPYCFHLNAVEGDERNRIMQGTAQISD